MAFFFQWYKRFFRFGKNSSIFCMTVKDFFFMKKKTISFSCRRFVCEEKSLFFQTNIRDIVFIFKAVLAISRTSNRLQFSPKLYLKIAQLFYWDIPYYNICKHWKRRAKKWATLSDQSGHGTLSFTMKTYVLSFFIILSISIIRELLSQFEKYKTKQKCFVSQNSLSFKIIEKANFNFDLKVKEPPCINLKNMT